MAKDTSINIRMNSELKQQSEQLLAQFGLNMTSVVNMQFHQIVRDKAIPFSLSLSPRAEAVNELLFARQERQSEYYCNNIMQLVFMFFLFTQSGSLRKPSF